MNLELESKKLLQNFFDVNTYEGYLLIGKTTIRIC